MTFIEKSFTVLLIEMIFRKFVKNRNLFAIIGSLLFVLFIKYSFFRSHDQVQTHTFLNSKFFKKLEIKPPAEKKWIFETPKTYNFSIFKLYSSFEYSEQALSTLKHGEMGAPVIVPIERLRVMHQLMKKHNFNLLASDMISVKRTLKDARFPECKKIRYPKRLPSASIIIIFHNEPWSTLIRTIMSVINRSPFELIEEIILVDDFSTEHHLKKPLDDYMNKMQLMPDNIKIIRSKKREGLIRARLLGAKKAKGNVLIFLDAHVECTHGWLEPLLTHIANDRSRIAVPQIDFIASENMEYKISDVKVTGFDWDLDLIWLDISKKELFRNNGDKTAPIRTPIMVGCAFAVDSKFFFEFGSFDEQMDIWGYENVELGFRAWQCGASMEIIPCSRVGHLFRVLTYSFEGDEDTIKIKNKRRVAEVWMDEYKKYLYIKNPDFREIPTGNLTERNTIKRKFKCLNFRWFLENIYPESEMYIGYKHFGQFKNAATKHCLEVLDPNFGQKINLYQCDFKSANQLLTFQNNGQILHAAETCLDVDDLEKPKLAVKLVKCHTEDGFRWELHQKQIKKSNTNYCMTAIDDELQVAICDTTDLKQQWHILDIYDE